MASTLQIVLLYFLFGFIGSFIPEIYRGRQIFVVGVKSKLMPAYNKKYFIFSILNGILGGIIAVLINLPFSSALPSGLLSSLAIGFEWPFLIGYISRSKEEKQLQKIFREHERKSGIRIRESIFSRFVSASGIDEESDHELEIKKYRDNHKLISYFSRFNY